MNKSSEFDKIFTQGYTCAVANIIRLHGDSTIAEDVYRNNCYTLEELIELGVDESDLEVIKPIIAEINRKSNVFKNSQVVSEVF